MSASRAHGRHDDVVARLRAAGCVWAEDEAALLVSAADDDPAALAAMVDQRAAGTPLEHVVGWARFHGMRVTVRPGVFVPRRRSEFLVDQALALAAGREHAVVVDLCCGSGALGLAVAAALPAVELHAVDIDPAAVACARQNLGAAGQVRQGDLFGPLPGTLRGRVDLLLANVPYVPTDEVGLLPAEAREHEAPVALDGGPDGLDVLRRVLADAADWLAPSGCLLTEVTQAQAPTAEKLMATRGLRAWAASCEQLAATVVVGAKA